MQALFTAYATAVKKPVEDDSGSENIARSTPHDIEFVSRFCRSSNRTRAEDRVTKSRHSPDKERH